MLNKILFLSLLFLAQGILAVEVKGLYDIEVLAKGRSDEDRNTAIQEALKKVLGRVLAADDILQTPDVKTVLADASEYIRQFQFSMSAAGQSDQNARLLRVEFEEQRLLNFLRFSNIGIWSEIRPETLIWLVVDDQGVRQFYSPDNMPEVENALVLATQLKGLPVIFPMLDLEEQRKISVNEVLSADSRHLLKMSDRYDVVSVMAGRIINKGDCWQAEWGLYFDNKIKQWISSCRPLNEMMVSGMQGAYDVLSKYYGVKPKTLEKGFTLKKIEQ